MGRNLLSLGNFARAAKILALLFFLLPWATASCSVRQTSESAPEAQWKIRASGAALATGRAVLEVQSPPDSAMPPNPFGRPDLPILAGALLILLSLGATFFVEGRKRAIAAMTGLALAAGALCYSILWRFPRVVDQFTAEIVRINCTPPLDQIRQQVTVHDRIVIEIGFWLTLAALAAAIALHAIVLIRRPQNSAPAVGEGAD